MHRLKLIATYILGDEDTVDVVELPGARTMRAELRASKDMATFLIA